MALAFSFGDARQTFAVSPEKFFQPPTRSPAALDPNGIYPLGGEMALGLYSIFGNSKIDPKLSNMHRAAESGFTLAGPYYEYGKDWRDFSHIYAAANEGMKFTYQIRPPAESLVPIDDRPKALKKLSDAQMAAFVREQITAVLKDPIASKTVARWTLGVEEVRDWKSDEMRYLKVASQTIRAVETELNMPHRPFWMYEPGHRNTKALVKTGAFQDIVSMGVYLTDLPRGPERSGKAIWGYTQIVSAANKLNTSPQAVLQLSKDFTDLKTGKNPAEIRRVLRHDAYLGLVMGIKGFNVWSMQEQRPNLTTHNEQFQAYASVVEDLTGDLDLQNVFLHGEPRNDLNVSITNGTKSVKFKDFYGKKFTFDTLHYLNTAVGDDRYLFLVNSTEQPMDVSISGLPSSFLMDDLFAGTTTEVRQTSLTHRLDVLGVSAFRFRQLLAGTSQAAGSLRLQAVPEPSVSALIALAGFCGLSFSRNRIARKRLDY
jgi:hypothetical protein